MDYSALAKQFGGTSDVQPTKAVPTGTVDYSALAKQFGGTTVSAPATKPTSTKYDVVEPQNLKIERLNAENQITREKADKANSFMERYVRPVADSVLPGVASLGDTIGSIINTNRNTDSYRQTLQTLSDQQVNLQKRIRELDNEGKDTTHLKQLFNAGQDSIQRIKERQDEEQSGAMKSTGKVAGELGLTALNTLTAGTYGKAAGTMQTGKLVLPTLKSAAPSAVSAIAKTSKGQILPGIAKGSGVGYAYDVALGLEGSRGEDRTGTKALIPGAVTALGGALGGTVPALTSIAKGAKNLASKQNAINDLERTYTELYSGTTAGKKTIDKIGAKTEALNRAGTEGRTPQRTLAESGVIPKRSGTKLDTYEQAATYRDTIAPLREVNRQALKETGLSTAPVKLEELEARAIQYANTPENINAGRFDSMKKDIQAEFALLKTHYPSGEIPLSVVDDIKSARWDNVFKNKSLIEADVLKKNSEYAIAKSLQKTIEDISTKAGNPEVAQLNREIGDRLEAAKFLESLNGKTIKGGRLLKYVTTAIGSSLGATIPGKIIGAIGGNLVGELIISNNVAGPIKRLLLSNLEAKDPAAYTKTIEWLRKQQLDRDTRLLLPAPKPAPKIGSEGNPRIMPDPTQFNPDGTIKNTTMQTPNAAKTNLPTVNPKSGRMQTTYTSEAAQEKSPNSQQTNPAIIKEASKPISKIIPRNEGKVNLAAAVGIGVSTLGTAVAKLFSALPAKTINYGDGTKSLPPKKIYNIGDKEIGDAIYQLESSSGADKGSADPGEMKWTYGITEVAIKELQRIGAISKIDKNNEDDIRDAAVKYFKLMQKRHPDESPAEIYVNWYWGQGKTQAQKDAKLKKFKDLTV